MHANLQWYNKSIKKTFQDLKIGIFQKRITEEWEYLYHMIKQTLFEQ